MTSEIESKDPRRLPSLAVDNMTASSPFPSPGSSFLPPPTPGPHEFAVRPPSAGTNAVRFSRRSSKNLKKDMDNKGGTSTGPTGVNTDSSSTCLTSNGHSGSNGVVSPIKGVLFLFPRQLFLFVFVSMLKFTRLLSRCLYFQASQPTAHTPTVVCDPTTPTPGTTFSAIPISPVITPTQLHPQSLQTFQSDQQFQAQSLPEPSPQPNDTQRLSTSLTSSRPAPPSPAVSRRASTAPSTHSRTSSSSRPISDIALSQQPSGRPVSGTISRLGAGINSRPQSARRSKDVIAPALAMSTVDGREMDIHARNQDSIKSQDGTEVSDSDPKRAEESTSIMIKIRDFGFPATDARFMGLGVDIPRANRPSLLERRLRGAPTSDSSDEEGDEWDEEEDEGDNGGDGGAGWGGFGWAGFGRLSWGAGRGADADGGFPNDTDFARNFGNADGDDESEVWEDGQEGDYMDDEEDAVGEDDEPPLLPGLYRALFAFEPEGTAEMRLEEDQVVRVVGRGGGVGWAVVVTDQKASGPRGQPHALVPESYLEVVKLD